MDPHCFIFAMRMSGRLTGGDIHAPRRLQGESLNSDPGPDVLGEQLNDLPYRFMNHRARNGLHVVSTRVDLLKDLLHLPPPMNPDSPEDLP